MVAGPKSDGAFCGNREGRRVLKGEASLVAGRLRDGACEKGFLTGK